MKRAVLLVVAACTAPAPASHVTIRPLPPLPAAPTVAKPQPALAPPLVDDDDDSFGAASAPVTMIVFSDPESVWMPRVWTALQELRKAYPADRVRIVLKHYPLDFEGMSPLVAEAVHGSYVLGGPDAAWAFLGHVFAPREQPFSRDELVAWAKASGVKDIAAFERGLDGRTWAGKIERDHHTGEKKSIRGVPTMFINGVELGGARPADMVREVIDKELAEADKLVASGTPARDVSAVRARANLAGPGEQPAFRLDDWRDDADALAKPVFAIPADGPTSGPATALVTVVAYLEPSNHYCGWVHDKAEGLRVGHEDDVRVVYRTIGYEYRGRDDEDAVANFLLEARAQKGDAGYLAALAKRAGAVDRTVRLRVRVRARGKPSRPQR